MSMPAYAKCMVVALLAGANLGRYGQSRMEAANNRLQNLPMSQVNA
jgi:hypothetical protein